MDFELPEEVRMIRETVSRFVQTELIPVEPLILRLEAERGYSDAPSLPPDLDAALQAKAKSIGLWGIDVPKEYGGQNYGTLAKAIVIEQLKNSIVPFVLPPDSPNLYLLKSACKGKQIDKYLIPYGRGEKKSCIAITEPGAGSDISALKTHAERRHDKWVLNGNKIWITNARHSDFMIVIAVTDAVKGKNGGMTAFLVDKGTKGVSVPAVLPTIVGEHHPYTVFFDDVELNDSQVLGEVGEAFIPLQQRLGVRRMEIAARSLGLAERCIKLMIDFANRRSTFGQLLKDRQAVQWWIADSYQELEMARMLTYRLAWKIDNGADFSLDAAMAKVQATEMIQRVADRAIQLHGGMGLSKELPLEYISRLVRVFRIVEGASEVHRWTLGRRLLKNGLPLAG
jgi:(R)-benzylsuccinyl-CoA dehydrogenase